MQSEGRGLEETIRSMVEGAILREGVELIGTEFRREPVGWVLRLFLDKVGGVSLEDCRRVSEVVGTLLEVEDPIPQAYTLEVSSPGLTRPLVSQDDWRRAVGTPVRIVTKQPLAGMQEFMGKLLESGVDAVRIDLEGTEVEIPVSAVARARREVDWPAGDRGKKRRRRETRGRAGK